LTASYIERGELDIGQQEMGMDFTQFSKGDMYFIFSLLEPCINLISAIDGINNGGDEPGVQINQLWASPRDVIRMFHRRSACSCLKDLYYNLKDNIPKMTRCGGCMETSDTKNIFECECKQIFYCSRECAKSHWVEHKSECVPIKKSEQHLGCKRENEIRMTD
jgi:hypothetical protein